MPDYDATQFDPPAPLARVTLRHPDTGAIWDDVLMLLDSGADITPRPTSRCPSVGRGGGSRQTIRVNGF